MQGEVSCLSKVANKHEKQNVRCRASTSLKCEEQVIQDNCFLDPVSAQIAKDGKLEGAGPLVKKGTKQNHEQTPLIWKQGFPHIFQFFYIFCLNI